MSGIGNSEKEDRVCIRPITDFHTAMHVCGSAAPNSASRCTTLTFLCDKPQAAGLLGSLLGRVL